MKHFFEWQVIAIACDKVVLDVEGRNGSGKSIVVRVDLLAEIRRLVDRLSVCIAAQNREAPAGALQRQLQRVVRRVAHGVEIDIAAEVVSERLARSVDDLSVAPRVDAVLAERSAGGSSRSDLARLAYAETQSGIARIG